MDGVDIPTFETMAGAMVERGLATPEQVTADRAALMAELGLPPQAPAAAATSGQGPSSNTLGTAPAAPGQPGATAPQEVDPIDTLVFQGAASPQEYRFGQLAPGTEYNLEQESAFRTLFHQHEIPPAIGNEIGRLWNQAAAAPPTDAQLEQGRQACSAHLNHLWGEDTPHHLAVAQAEVQRMAKTNPEIVQMLEVSGLGNSPWLASTLYNLARARGRG